MYIVHCVLLVSKPLKNCLIPGSGYIPMSFFPLFANVHHLPTEVKSWALEGGKLGARAPSTFRM